MKYKVYNKFDKTMYWNAELIVDGKWNLAKLMLNKHCETDYDIDKKDSDGVLIYTNDLIELNNESLVRVSKIKNGKITLYNDKETYDIDILDHIKSKVVGSYWEAEDLK